MKNTISNLIKDIELESNSINIIGLPLHDLRDNICLKKIITATQSVLH